MGDANVNINMESLNTRALMENGGKFWQQLRAEREEVCERLIHLGSDANEIASSQIEIESLQERLQQIDGAMDDLIQQTQLVGRQS